MAYEIDESLESDNCDDKGDKTESFSERVNQTNRTEPTELTELIERTEPTERIERIERNKPDNTEADGCCTQHTPFIQVEQLKNLYQANGRKKFVAVDWGEARIGVATSDALGLVAGALCTLARTPHQMTYRTSQRMSHRTTYRKAYQSSHLQTKDGRKGQKDPQQETQRRENLLLDQLVQIIIKEDPLAIIMGLPKNMNGSLGFQAEKVEQFALKLASRIPYPIFFQDERLSSVAMERIMIQADRTRNQRKKVLDASAAAFVLQGVLNLLKFSQEYEGAEMEPDKR